MKFSEKFKIDEDGERKILEGGGSEDLQVRPRSGWVARWREHSFVEERPQKFLVLYAFVRGRIYWIFSHL